MRSAAENQVQMTISLTLPRDEATVAVVRHIVRASLEELGVQRGCVSDIEIAMSEASTNVLRHADHGDAYEVTCELSEATCVVRIVDRGRGFDDTPLGF